MNDYRDGRLCYFHPRELVVGVCALCLNERLLVLASKPSQRSNRSSIPPNKSLPKIFALTSLLNRSEIKHHKSEDFYSSSTSQEDSFISIKFENNGVASWEKSKISKLPLDQKGEIPMNDSVGNKNEQIKSVIEHVKPRGGVLRWRKRIGHLFQVMRWKRSSKSNLGTKLEGSKGRYGWIRYLTKKRTKE